MRPKAQEISHCDDLFRSRLDQIIDLKHALVLLSEKIDWSSLDEQVGIFYKEKGRPAIPSRLLIGLHLLKEMYNLSDETVCERWIENPYYQYFCGETYFQYQLKMDRSSMTRWRKRVSPSLIEKLLQESLRVAREEKALKPIHCKRVVADTTVQPKAIAFPRDARTQYIAIKHLVKLAKAQGIELRQSYLRVCKRALTKSGRYRHAKQLKRAKREEAFIRVRLSRLIRDIERKIKGGFDLEQILSEPLLKAKQVRDQVQKRKNKLYAWHAPEVVCISKGKAGKAYEFGSKVSVTTNINKAPGGHFVFHIDALEGNPYDGHTLDSALEKTEENTGTNVERVYVDRGYQGHRCEDYSVYRSGQKRGVVGSIKKELKRRPVVEPVIGHLKSEGRLDRNYLYGRVGDQMNAGLVAVGHNFRLLLKWLPKKINARIYEVLERLLASFFVVAV